MSLCSCHRATCMPCGTTRTPSPQACAPHLPARRPLANQAQALSSGQLHRPEDAMHPGHEAGQ